MSWDFHDKHIQREIAIGDSLQSHVTEDVTDETAIATTFIYHMHDQAFFKCFIVPRNGLQTGLTTST